MNSWNGHSETLWPTISFVKNELNSYNVFIFFRLWIPNSSRSFRTGLLYKTYLLFISENLRNTKKGLVGQLCALTWLGLFQMHSRMNKSDTCVLFNGLLFHFPPMGFFLLPGLQLWRRDENRRFQNVLSSLEVKCIL